jgi:cytochrome c oxidase assembly protein subunit 15
LVVALVALVVIGGATRVMQAGLACPDWPLCYGALLPINQMSLQVFLEWFHRLDALVVLLALATLLVISVWRRDQGPTWLPGAAALALLLVLIQAGLGAATVLHLLAAPMVAAHLLTALLLLSLVSAIHQRLHPAEVPLPRWWKLLALVSGLAVLMQCLLGGLMASRWAAPLCLSSGVGCRWLLWHLQGAWPATIGVMALAITALQLPVGCRRPRRLALTAALLVGIQVGLGVLSLHWQLTIAATTVAHQLVAALLVAVIGALWGLSLPSTTPAVPAPLLEVVHG